MESLKCGTEYTKLLNEIAAIYHNLRDRQKEIVFKSKTEKEARKKRITALAFIAGSLSKVLKDRGDPRGEY